MNKPKESIIWGSMWYISSNIKMKLFASIKFRESQQWLEGTEYSLLSLSVYLLPWTGKAQSLYSTFIRIPLTSKTWKKGGDDFKTCPRQESVCILESGGKREKDTELETSIKK